MVSLPHHPHNNTSAATAAVHSCEALLTEISANRFVPFVQLPDEKWTTPRGNTKVERYVCLAQDSLAACSNVATLDAGRWVRENGAVLHV